MSRIADERLNHSSTHPSHIVDVVQQIQAEYREMPGLSLTEAQAQRLWTLDKTTCRRALDTLVQSGVLRRTRRESYVRAEIISRPSSASTRGGAGAPDHVALPRRATEATLSDSPPYESTE